MPTNDQAAPPAYDFEAIHPLLFPDFRNPEKLRFFLWCHFIGEVEDEDGNLVSDCWTSDGWMPEDIGGRDGVTSEEAIDAALRIDRVMLAALKNQSDKDYLWSLAARYQWLCEFGVEKDGASSDEYEAWAKAEGRLPA